MAYADAKPKTLTLSYELGCLVAKLSVGLKDFSHPGLERDFKWDLLKGLWVKDHLSLIQDPIHAQWLEAICESFAGCLSLLNALPKQALHNDLNDQNLLVDFDDGYNPFVSGVLDFGDLCLGPRVCELSVAGAYALLNHAKPIQVLTELVKGYNQVTPLTEDEISLIYPLLRMRLAVSVVNAALMKQEKPDDPYVVITERPAWTLLQQLTAFSEAEVHARLRVACGLTVVADDAMKEIQAMGPFAPVLGIDLNRVPKVDLSVTGDPTPTNPLNMDSEESLALGQVPTHR